MNFMCNVGDTVWCIERYEYDSEGSDVGGYIFVTQNDECVIVSPDPFGYNGTISQYLIEECTENMGTDLYVFPIKDVYLTKEEAEAAMDDE